MRALDHMHIHACACHTTLMRALDVPSADELTASLGVSVTIHPTVSSATLNGLIRDSTSPKGPPASLHFAIAYGSRNPDCTMPLPRNVAADVSHHYLTVWYTRLPGLRSVS